MFFYLSFLFFFYLFFTIQGKRENTGACVSCTILAACTWVLSLPCTCVFMMLWWMPKCRSIVLIEGSPSKYREHLHLPGKLTKSTKNTAADITTTDIGENTGAVDPIGRRPAFRCADEEKVFRSIEQKSVLLWLFLDTIKCLSKKSLCKSIKKLVFVEALAKISFWRTAKAGWSQANFTMANPSKFGVYASSTKPGSLSKALRTARRCGCDLRIDFPHLGRSASELIMFTISNIHATLYLRSTWAIAIF